jgi:hypothetical protein
MALTARRATITVRDRTRAREGSRLPGAGLRLLARERSRGAAGEGAHRGRGAGTLPTSRGCRSPDHDEAPHGDCLDAPMANEEQVARLLGKTAVSWNGRRKENADTARTSAPGRTSTGEPQRGAHHRGEPQRGEPRGQDESRKERPRSRRAQCLPPCLEGRITPRYDAASLPNTHRNRWQGPANLRPRQALAQGEERL